MPTLSTSDISLQTRASPDPKREPGENTTRMCVRQQCKNSSVTNFRCWARVYCYYSSKAHLHGIGPRARNASSHLCCPCDFLEYGASPDCAFGTLVGLALAGMGTFAQPIRKTFSILRCGRFFVDSPLFLDDVDIQPLWCALNVLPCGGSSST